MKKKKSLEVFQKGLGLLKIAPIFFRISLTLTVTERGPEIMFETLPLKLLIKTAFYLYQKSFSARNNKESEIFTRNWGKPEMGAEGGAGAGARVVLYWWTEKVLKSLYIVNLSCFIG